MVRVPISTDNLVQRQSAGDARFRYAEARDFVGPAVEQFGRTVQRAAEGFDQIEATYDEADALRLDNEMRQRARARLLDGDDAYLGKQGFAAGEARDKVLTDLNGDAESLLASARSERAREMARRSFQNRIATAEQQVSIHALREMEAARIGQSNARIEGALTDAIDARGTERFAVNLGLATQELAANAGRMGWSPEQLAEETDKLISNAYARSALAYDAEDGEPTRALSFIEQNKDMIRPDEQARLTAQLAPRVDGAWAQGVVQSGALDKYLIAAPVAAEATAPATGGAVPFERLAAITVQSESAGNPNAVSPKGARGLMQVMPATARDPGFGIRPSNGTPQDDVRVGREYLGKMQDRYGGDLAKMWAAYNAGPGAVDDAVRAHGANWLSRMPAETRDYVAKNMRLAGQGGGAAATPGTPGVAADPRLDSRLMREAVDKYVAENPGLSERRKQALYAAADQAVNVARADRAQAEQDADRRLQDWLNENKPGPDDLTSIDQIPAAIIAGISPSTSAALQNRIQITQARAEDRAAQIANGRAAQLEQEAIFELYTLSDAELANTDMRRYAGRIGMDKLGPWIDRQQSAAEKVANGRGNLVSGDRIASRIDSLGKAFGASRDSKATPEERKLWADVRGYVEERVAGRSNKDVTDEDLRAIVLSGLAETQIEGGGWFGSNIGNTTVPRAQLGNRGVDLDDLPADVVAKIRAGLVRGGLRNPSSRDIFDAYQEGRARGIYQ